MSWLSKRIAYLVKRIARDTRYSIRGFTLVEVLVAIAILAFGLALVAEAMGRSEQITRTANNLITASALAEEQFSNSEVEMIDRHKLSWGRDQGEIRPPGRKFMWQKSHDHFVDESIKDETKMSRIEVTVNWAEGGRGNNQLTLSSLLLNREKKL